MGVLFTQVGHDGSVDPNVLDGWCVCNDSGQADCWDQRNSAKEMTDCSCERILSQRLLRPALPKAWIVSRFVFGKSFRVTDWVCYRSCATGAEAGWARAVFGPHGYCMWHRYYDTWQFMPNVCVPATDLAEARSGV